MSTIQDEAEVTEARVNPLVDDPAKDLKVTASLRDQQLVKLKAKLEELEMGEKIAGIWTRANTDRSEWLERQEGFLKEIDEFLDPIYKPALEWSSTLHLPTILTVCKTYHGRMLAALWGIDPPFVCRSRTAANADRAGLVEDLMRYTLRDWANEYDGVEEELDKWLWDWVTKGDGYLKARWMKRFSRFQDIISEQVPDTEMRMDPETGHSVPVQVTKEVEREVAVTKEVYNGPELARVPTEDIIVIGGDGDPQKAEMVLQQSWLTASELWTLADQKLFDAGEVEEVIESGRDWITGNDQTGNIKQTQILQGGNALLNKEHELDKYRIIEAYIKADIDGSGINSDIIVWIHWKTRCILRATYLHRVMPSGKRPFFRIEFHKRHGVEHSAGLVELLYSLGKEIDAMHNINIDVGILSSLPFGFYKPTTSSLKEEALPIEPGALIPVDNPQSDIFFPNLGLRTSFGFQEHQALMQQVERLTSISDLNLGLIGPQGAARTATGTRALLGESSSNLNVYIQRMNRGWKRALRYMFEMLQFRLPPGFQFRVLGDDGDSYWQRIESQKELDGLYDFELEANSGNSNKQVQLEQANLIYQVTSDPINLQLGICTPSNRYEAALNMLKLNGVKALAKFLTKPANHQLMFTPLEIADRVLMGVDVPLNPAMDLQGFITVANRLLTEQDLNGQFGPTHVIVLKHKMQEAQGLMAAVQSAQGTANVAQQQNMNTQASMVPGNMQPVSITQEPPPGMGGGLPGQALPGQLQ